MSGNRPLTQAKRQKRDEFYTQLSDVEKELRHYKAHFEGKVVYCNCDDPYESNFFKYFAANFNALRLKRLITTSYAGSPVCGEQLSLDDIEGLDRQRQTERAVAYKTDIRGVADLDGDGGIGLSDVKHLLRYDPNTSEHLKGNGDFRDDECIELLEQCDIVVTNPPFSLFREYLAQLIEHDKQFLILGQQNAITYKEVFPLIKDGTVWLGVNNGGDKWFQVPDHYENAAAGHSKWENGVKYHKLRSVNWFTNLDHQKRYEKLILYKKHTPEEYPKYDNYDAIEVSRVAEIPADYEGAMGVPISFLDKFNPHQFQILGITDRDNNSGLKTKEYTLGDAPNPNDLNRRGAITVGDNLKSTYARILIKASKASDED